MLQFIHKYQKTLFATVAALLCISILFLGMLPKHGAVPKDKVVYKTLNGKKIKQSKYEGMKILLNTNCGDYAVMGQQVGMQYFDENFISNHFLKPKTLNSFLKNDEVLKSELKEIFEKDKKYKNYQHPEASYLSAEAVWQLKAPDLKKSYDAYTSERSIEAAVNKKAELFLNEQKFTSFDLWQNLMDQQAQLHWLTKDQQLYPASLSLFGTRSISDWFGASFVESITKFIFEVAAVAKEKGYKVSHREAEDYLFSQNEKNFRKLKAIGVSQYDSAQDYLHAKQRALGLSQMDMVSLVKEILRFERFFNESTNSLLIDQKSIKPFEEYANQSVQLEKYTLPKFLSFKEEQDLAQFECYLNVLGKPLDQLSLHFDIKPFDQIAKMNPEFVEYPLAIEYKDINLSKAALKIRTQDLYAYKFDPVNFDKLNKKFEKLQLKKDDSEDQIQAAYDKLDYLASMQLDQFIKGEVVKIDPDWKEKAFLTADVKNEEVLACANGAKLPFLTMDMDAPKIMNQLLKFADSDEKVPFNIEGEHQSIQILDVKKLGAQRLVSYESLIENKVLEKLVEKRLKEMGMNKMSQLLDGLYSSIIQNYLAEDGSSSKDLDTDFYVSHRLYKPLSEMRKALKDGNKDCTFSPIWSLNQSKETYIRSEMLRGELDAYLSLDCGAWTEMELKNNKLQFAQILNKDTVKTSSVLQNQLLQDVEAELKRDFITKFLDKIGNN